MTSIDELAPPRARPGLVAIVFTLTIFTSASLLFFVQPLFTKIVLPQIGGAPAVWTTAMLFFQTVLIAGYLYAHLSSRHLAPRWQLGLHLALWGAALAFLPLAIPEGWRYDAAGSTEWQTLALYAAGVGLPFAVLSANAPLLQAWYARSGGPSAQDPYFLYGASNLGSLIALLAFPLLAEPLFGASGIGIGWAAGFLALGPLLMASGLAAGGIAAPAAVPLSRARGHQALGALPSLRKLGLWAFLAFLPSSLMLGVTAKIGTDLGSIPLVWVIPLALYLLTFVIAFTNRPLFGMTDGRSLLLGSLAVLVVLSTGLVPLGGVGAGMLVLGFFGVGLAAHRALFLSRPEPAHLTIFYLTMSVGGALGGVFNSLVAPRVFSGFHELWITSGLAVLLLLPAAGRARPREILLGAAMGGLAMLPVALLPAEDDGSAGSLAVLGVAILLAVALSLSRNRAWTSAAAALVVLGACVVAASEDAIHRERSFFGVHAILEGDGIRRYTNGTTIHGAERIADSLGGRAPKPLTYYTPEGPMGQVLGSSWAAGRQSVGVVGLGVGSLACYARPGQDWHFYEIDRTVDEIARNPAYFTFLSACAGDAPTHLGDARIVLDQQKDIRFDILVIDAYSSDAIPVHLTTKEAVALYRARLNPGGVVLFHISNRFYAVDRPLGRIAAALGLRAYIQRHVPQPGASATAHSASVVVAMTEPGEAAPAWLEDDPRLQALASDGGAVWTDDYANPLSILN